MLKVWQLKISKSDYQFGNIIIAQNKHLSSRHGNLKHARATQH